MHEAQSRRRQSIPGHTLAPSSLLKDFAVILFTPTLALIGARISRSSQAEDWMPAYASMTKGTSFPRKRESRRRFLATHWLSEPLNLAPMTLALPHLRGRVAVFSSYVA
jgi:hypothetical protein